MLRRLVRSKSKSDQNLATRSAVVRRSAKILQSHASHALDLDIQSRTNGSLSRSLQEHQKAKS